MMPERESRQNDVAVALERLKEWALGNIEDEIDQHGNRIPVLTPGRDVLLLTEEIAALRAERDALRAALVTLFACVHGDEATCWCRDAAAAVLATRA